MKRPMGMNIMRGTLLVALALPVIACGGDESVASKSAAAYREAQAKRIPVGGGQEHGGHEAATATGGPAEMDHSAHGTGADTHAGHDMKAGSTADHTGHGAMAATDHAAMGHGTQPTAAHAQHGAAAGTASRDAHAGMQHDAPSAGADAHAQHGMTGAATAPGVAGSAMSAPRSNAEMRGVQPASTLQPDAFDAPDPISVSEATKATQGGGHSQHGAAQPTQANPVAAVVYTCPMHPEVTSDNPGTCPKCGMTLVKKN